MVHFDLVLRSVSSKRLSFVVKVIDASREEHKIIIFYRYTGRCSAVDSTSRYIREGSYLGDSMNSSFLFYHSVLFLIRTESYSLKILKTKQLSSVQRCHLTYVSVLGWKSCIHHGPVRPVLTFLLGSRIFLYYVSGSYYHSTHFTYEASCFSSFPVYVNSNV